MTFQTNFLLMFVIYFVPDPVKRIQSHCMRVSSSVYITYKSHLSDMTRSESNRTNKSK